MCVCVHSHPSSCKNLLCRKPIPSWSQCAPMHLTLIVFACLHSHTCTNTLTHMLAQALWVVNAAFNSRCSQCRLANPHLGNLSCQSSQLTATSHFLFFLFLTVCVCVDSPSAILIGFPLLFNLMSPCAVDF